MTHTNADPGRDVNHGVEDRERAVLLIDADDTLWENNIYFIAVTAEYASVLAERGVDREEALSVLSGIEAENIAHFGYGSMSYARSIRQAFLRLDPGQDNLEAVRLEQLARSIFERETVELRLGVAEALRRLQNGHRLILLTKGDPQEQEKKLDRSGLRCHFEWVEVVPEKRLETYRQLVDRLGLDPQSTWMIGNSPRSDINPALAAGLGAILIPHPSTWELEMEEITAYTSDRFLVLDSLLEVADYFERSGRDALNYRAPPSEAAP